MVSVVLELRTLMMYSMGRVVSSVVLNVVDIVLSVVVVFVVDVRVVQMMCGC